MYNVLVCDDELSIVASLKIYLSSEGYSVFEAHNGLEAIEVLGSTHIDLVVMDVMMPEMDGLTALSKIREQQNAVPVILLTAKGEDYDKVIGLNVGADDYITKPFNPVELLARVKSNIRRYRGFGGAPAQTEDAQQETGVLINGGIEMDDRSKLVTLDGEPIKLTPTEYEILKLFLENTEEVMSPKDIYKKVWNDSPMGAENTVMVHIRHLREKLEFDPANPVYLKVVWGHGYKMAKRSR